MNYSDNVPVEPNDPTQGPFSWESIRNKIPQLKKIPLKPYTLKDLASIYRVSVPTFKKMIKPHQPKIGLQVGRYICIAQVRRIFLYVDHPSTYTLKDLARLYGVSIPTFKVWLGKFENELGEKTGHFFSIRQLYIIICKLDVPSADEKGKDDLISLLRIYL